MTSKLIAKGVIMSRTYRHTKWNHFQTESQYLDEELACLSSRVSRYPEMYNRKRVRKTKAEYAADMEKASGEYVSKYKWIQSPVDWEAEIKDLKQRFAKRTRDGYCNESGRNKYFKKLSKKEVRAKTRQLEVKIYKDEDWDQYSYPADYLGKKHIWSVW
jgi:hypothetical protein